MAFEKLGKFQEHWGGRGPEAGNVDLRADTLRRFLSKLEVEGLATEDKNLLEVGIQCVEQKFAKGSRQKVSRMCNIATVFVQIGNADRAIQLLVNASKEAKSIQHREERYNAFLTIAETMFLARGDRKTVQKVLYSALAMPTAFNGKSENGGEVIYVYGGRELKELAKHFIANNDEAGARKVATLLKKARMDENAAEILRWINDNRTLERTEDPKLLGEAGEGFGRDGYRNRAIEISSRILTSAEKMEEESKFKMLTHAMRGYGAAGDYEGVLRSVGKLSVEKIMELEADFNEEAWNREIWNMTARLTIIRPGWRTFFDDRWNFTDFLDPRDGLSVGKFFMRNEFAQDDKRAAVKLSKILGLQK